MNVVPQEVSQLSIEEYNQIIKELFSDLRAFFRKQKLKIKTRLGKEKIGLEEIITSKRAREAFELFMGQCPLSYHPLDIERLDKFTGSLFRNSRKKKPNLDQLASYLENEKSWTPKEVKWCIDRIDIGYDVLTANK